MKKVLSLVLVAVLALSAGATAFADTNTGDKDATTSANTYEEDKGGADGYSSTSTAELTVETGSGDLLDENIIDGTLYLSDKGVTREYQSGLDIDYVIKNTSYKDLKKTDKKSAEEVQREKVAKDYKVSKNIVTFEGPSAYESTSYKISYTDKNGSHSGSPKGVNGEELLKIRVAYDHERRAYSITMTPVENPTVEIFSNLEVKLKIVKVVNRTTFAMEQNVWKGFNLMNKRYTSKDVYKDASGKYRINAGDEYPVVDESAFNKAYGKQLTVDYPDYRVIFKNVKNQDIALNLEADLVKAPTVSFDGTKPILQATFHDIYVKDAAEIEFKVNADAQNYKGTTGYAYKVDANGNLIKDSEITVKITDSSSVVIEIPAGTRLGAYGEANKLSTYAIFGEKQDAKASSSSSSSSSDKGTTSTSSNTSSSSNNNYGNTNTGASDVVNVATVFAVVSLAAAGFVAVNKASK